MQEINKILFVSMPWASAKRPLLGIGILTNKLNKSGYKAKSLYLNIDFANTFGLSNYEFFADNPSLYPLAEYLFAANLFNYDIQEAENFIVSNFGKDFILKNPDIISSIKNLKDEIIPAFIENCLAQVLELDFQVIGFTSTFNQIFPSLLLAKRIKEKSPDKIIILGGSCFHDEMGVEYSLGFSDFIDYVFTGESDNSLPQFINYLNGLVRFDSIDGIAQKGNIHKNSQPILNLREVSSPDYEDYFEKMHQVFGSSATIVIEGIPFESSRGCWWGQKNHCTFCGLNSMGMDYRYKNDDIIIQELNELSSKHKTINFLAADNILRSNAYHTLLPKLSTLPYKFNLFYEIKANLRRKDVYALYTSNINWIQPGIENFSTNILKLMRKGVSAIQNIQLLKFAKEYGINVSYNILCGFSGETLYDYEEMIKVFNKIKHLQPPSGLATHVQIHRFSPMYNSSEEYGFTNVRPCQYYNKWFPPGFVNLDKIAYFFEYDRAFEEISLGYLNEHLQKWLDSDINIYAELGYDFILITKVEKNKVIERIPLDEIDSVIFLMTDEITNKNIIYSLINKSFNCPDIERRLNRLKSLNILFNEGEKYLNIIPFLRPQVPGDIDFWLNSTITKIQQKTSFSKSIAASEVGTILISD